MARPPVSDCYDYVRKYYRVPAYIGMRVCVQRRQGTLVNVRSGDQYLHVLFDDSTVAVVVHPTDGVLYLVQPSPFADALPQLMQLALEVVDYFGTDDIDPLLTTDRRLRELARAAIASAGTEHS